MAQICSIASKILVTVMVCASTFSGASAAQPLPAYDPGQYNNTPLNAPPQGLPQAGLATPPNPNGPAPDAADPAVAGNLNLSMPDVNFRNLLTKLQAPASDLQNQYSTPDTTSSYSTSQPPPGPAQRDLATPFKLP